MTSNYTIKDIGNKMSQIINKVEHIEALTKSSNETIDQDDYQIVSKASSSNSQLLQENWQYYSIKTIVKQLEHVTNIVMEIYNKQEILTQQVKDIKEIVIRQHDFGQTNPLKISGFKEPIRILGKEIILKDSSRQEKP